MARAIGGFLLTVARRWMTNIYIYICNSCMTQTGMQLFCHPKYSVLYGTLMIFVVGSGQE